MDCLTLTFLESLEDLKADLQAIADSISKNDNEMVLSENLLSPARDMTGPVCPLSLVGMDKSNSGGPQFSWERQTRIAPS